jgi:starch synthase (maltosyl-transferring)
VIPEVPRNVVAVTPESRTHPEERGAEERAFESAGAAKTAKAPRRTSKRAGRTPAAGDGGAGSAPKIYYLHYPLLGALAHWPAHLTRCRAMGFDHVAVPPLWVPGRAGNVFLTGNFARPNPIFDLAPGDDAVAAVAALCARHDLKLILDLVVDRVAGDAAGAVPDAAWFDFPAGGDAMPDPRRGPREIARARFPRPEVAAGLAAWWSDRLRALVRNGVAGFRCLGMADVPPEFWRRIIAAVRAETPRCLFLGWTVDTPVSPDWAGLGFDGVCAVVGGVADFHRVVALRRIAPVIAMPEEPFGPRLAPAGGAMPAAYQRGLALASALGDGLLVPMGFEYAASRPLDPAYSIQSDLREAEMAAGFPLDGEIAAAIARLDRVAALHLRGEWRALADNALLRLDRADPRQADSGLVLIGNDDVTTARVLELPLAPLPKAAGAAFERSARLAGEAAADAPLQPGEMRLVRVARSAAVATGLRGGRPAALRAATAPRIAIEAVTPAIDGGRFAAKGIVGDAVEVEADIFIDGHDALAASLLWRSADESEWRRAPLTLADNDRWRGTFRSRRVGRHHFVVEAWLDRWTSLCHDIEKKHAAGQDLSLDFAEAALLVEAAEKRATGEPKRQLVQLRKALGGGGTGTDRLTRTLSAETAALMAAADDRPFLTRSEPELAVDVDRPQAGFASWYEMFPRSATDDPTRPGNFGDVIAQLPRIARMGFDVLYFPPIHPIGGTNRKGRNNALTAEPGDPGSPYAIGSAAGGHTAIDPALGTMADFRRLRDAAHEHGLELALDFAVQCSPDHPWLKEHPDWFRHRADGSIRYAENPPKKYEDIVNPDFYAPAAIPDLWLALRDAVMFWADEGVRIFRVDNPHTKPLPFWEWLIADIKARYPETIFLAEAFTRPKPMYRLAKLGFTQSYTYFTWRNAKGELTDYLRELADGPPRDFFRPNFFVNTPDINPFFLQHSGRAGFLIRAALATTLSGSWGMYSGFELCEAAPLPNREEYLDSEKYQVRVRDFDAPGNIAGEIALLNRIRRDHVALQTHLGIGFYNAFNDHIMVYGKALRRRGEPVRDMILVAVTLDPHQTQEATYELPLWEFGLPDHGTLAVDDLVRPQHFTLTGKYQQMRLDPSVLPFAIWRLSARSA